MKNISETDGLSRKKRLERASTPVYLPVLEERFPVLLDRALSRTEFSSLYKFQPLVVLLEMEQFDADAAEEAFANLSAPEQFVPVVYELVLRLDDWYRRLEYAGLSGLSPALLKDLSGQITTNISPMFYSFYKRYGGFPKRSPGRIWMASGKKNRDESLAKDFPQRFYLLLLAAVRLIQSKSETYREEIYASGMMDPSLALLVAFLDNYKEIAEEFNARWQKLPMFYLDNILKVLRKQPLSGTTWLAFESSPVGAGTALRKDSYWKADRDELAMGYRLLSDIVLTKMSLAGVKMVVLERKKDRYPEAALNYVTAVKRSNPPEMIYSSEPIGFCLQSSMLLLKEGKREINILFRLTEESLEFMDNTVRQVALAQEISRDETLYKILHDAFLVYASTAEGWRVIERCHIRYEEGKGLRLTVRLDEDYPAVSPPEGEELPSLRLLVNTTAWLFPYSWACRMMVESVKITVKVQGIRDLQITNDLGRVDIHQAFAPFGVLGDKGAWLAFGCFEMACKPLQEVCFSFNWQHLPACAGGLKEYYRTYDKDIDNRSFKGRIEQLRNRNWKPLSETGECYLFRTSASAIPLKEDPLIEHTSIEFRVTENTVLPVSEEERFQQSDVRSGFFRILLTEPEMGFGMHEYRRLFSEIMMYNSRARHKKALPEAPLSLLMDSPELSYTAEEECVFKVGSTVNIHLSYIRPLSDSAATQPDTSRPLPLLDGPENEGNLMIGIAGAVGENLIRMYIDMELMQREIDHDFLPRTGWYYRDAFRWIPIDAVDVLRDDTDGLMHSGAILLQLPFRITEEMTDCDGMFWICATVYSNLCNCSNVKGIYLNIVEAVPVLSEGTRLSVPGLLSCRRVAPLTGDRSGEDEVEIRTRLSERMAHRHRLLLPCEYEQMTLQEFPEIVKVKCFPGMDAKRQNRSSVVTLAIIHNRDGEDYPLCKDELLCRVENTLKLYSSPFTIIDAINPVYEEVTVFCGISLKVGEAAGQVIQEVHEGLKACIAPWNREGGIPVFGYSFSLRDMQNRMKEGGKVSKVYGMKLLQVVSSADGTYDLKEYILAEGEEQVVAPSVPWAILVPASRLYVELVDGDEWRKEIEIGDFEVENTFVIR